VTGKNDLLNTVYTRWSILLKGLHKVICVLLAAGMTVIMFAVVFHVLGRYFFGKTYMGTMELVRYTMIWISMLGTAAAFGVKEHPCIDFLGTKLSSGAWFRVRLAGNLMLCLFLIVMIMGGTEITLKNWHQTSLGLQIPMFYPYLGIPVGGIVILPYIVMDMLTAVMRLKGEKESHL